MCDKGFCTSHSPSLLNNHWVTYRHTKKISTLHKLNCASCFNNKADESKPNQLFLSGCHTCCWLNFEVSAPFDPQGVCVIPWLLPNPVCKVRTQHMFASWGQSPWAATRVHEVPRILFLISRCNARELECGIWGSKYSGKHLMSVLQTMQQSRNWNFHKW